MPLKTVQPCDAGAGLQLLGGAGQGQIKQRIEEVLASLAAAEVVPDCRRPIARSERRGRRRPSTSATSRAAPTSALAGAMSDALAAPGHLVNGRRWVADFRFGLGETWQDRRDRRQDRRHRDRNRRLGLQLHRIFLTRPQDRAVCPSYHQRRAQVPAAPLQKVRSLRARARGCRSLRCPACRTGPRRFYRREIFRSPP